MQFLFVKCVQWRFPMTTVNIAAGGFAGLVSGLIMYYLVAPFALQAGEFIKYLINLAISFNPIVAGVIGGLLIWPAILGGVYHAAILPIVLLEMEKTGNSFLGPSIWSGWSWYRQALHWRIWWRRETKAKRRWLPRVS